MKIRTSVLVYGLSLALVSPAAAQSNRGYIGYSDKGGPNVNGWDKGDHHKNSSRLKAAIDEVVAALARGSLTTPSGMSIPISAQLKVHAVLTRNTGTISQAPQRSAAMRRDAVAKALAANFAQLSAPLATAGPSAEATLPPLIRSLSGLAYNPDWIPTVIADYNNFVQSASASFLANPPPEFLAVHSVLAKLAAAAAGK
jgi:hypothetical protein